MTHEGRSSGLSLIVPGEPRPCQWVHHSEQAVAEDGGESISRSVAGMRPLLAERGCLVHDGARLRTLADVVAYPDHHPRALMGPPRRVRRPVEGRAGLADGFEVPPASSS